MLWKAGLTALALGAVLVSCSDDDGEQATGPSATVVDGVRYAASVEESVARNGRIYFLVSVTLTNTTDQTITRRYPVGCAVQIRLYRLLDGSRVYDEGTRTCTPTDSLTVSIPRYASVALSSGLRYPPSITGSIPAATYEVRAWARTESTGPIEVRAGSYAIPLYVD